MPHVEALYDFVVAYKKRLVPDYDPSAPVKKVQKDVDPEKLDGVHMTARMASARRHMRDVSLTRRFAPKIEQAKSGRATCKMTGEKIEKDELRVGLPVFCRGQQVTAWQKAAHFSKALRFETLPDNRSKCKASKEKITKGRDSPLRARRLGRPARGERRANRHKMYYNPMAIRPFWTAFPRGDGVRPSRSRAPSCSTAPTTPRYWTRTRTERAREADCWK